MSLRRFTATAKWLAVLASFVVEPAARPAPAQTDDDAAIRTLVRAYRDAVEAKDLNRLIALHALDPQIARKQLQQEWGDAFAQRAVISTQLAILKVGRGKDRALVHRWFRAYTCHRLDSDPRRAGSGDGKYSLTNV